MAARQRGQNAMSEIKEKTRPPMSPFFWYSSSKNRSDIKCFCFVEGKTDRKFYETFIASRLRYKKEQVEIIYGVGGDGGKTPVIMTAKKIDSQKEKCGKEAIYIVDRDYDDKEKRREHGIMKNITVLPCYSFENFIFRPKNNLKQVFRDAFGEHLWEVRYKEFDKALSVFMAEVIPYCAWKRLCVELPALAASLEHHQKGEDNVERILSNMKFAIPYNYPLDARSFTKDALDEIRSDHEYLVDVIDDYIDEAKADSGNIKGKLLLTFLAGYLVYRSAYGRKIQPTKEKLYTMGARFKVPIKYIKNKV